MKSYLIIIICYYLKRYKTILVVEHSDKILKEAPDLVLGKSRKRRRCPADRKRGHGQPEREAQQEGPQKQRGACPQEHQAPK